MSRFNTGNPLDSDRLEDLSDNAKNADLFSNDVTRESYTDRFGRNRKTIHGMELEFYRAQDERKDKFDADQKDRDDRFNEFLSSSGYQFLGDYKAGVEITEYNQLVRDENGEFWRVSGQIDLPYVTTGAGVDEDGALVSAGDSTLRQDLANPDKGAAMVGYGGGTVAEALGSKVTQISTVVDLRNTEPLYIGQLVYVIEYEEGTGYGGGLYRAVDVNYTGSDSEETLGGSRWRMVVEGSVFPIDRLGAIKDAPATVKDAFIRAIECVREAGSGTVYVGAGEWTMAGVLYEVNTSNITFHFDSGCHFKMRDTLLAWYPTATVKGYSNVAIVGHGTIETLEGMWHNDLVCVDGVELRDLTFIRPVHAGHFLDLMGCTNITVDGITVKGSNIERPNNPRLFSEFIQIGDDNVDGVGWTAKRAKLEPLMNRGVVTINTTLTNSVFIPYTDEDGVTTYPPRPIGNHGAFSGVRDIRIVGNKFKNVIRQDAASRQAWLEMPTVDGVYISGNSFIYTHDTDNVSPSFTSATIITLKGDSSSGGVDILNNTFDITRPDGMYTVGINNLASGSVVNVTGNVFNCSAEFSDLIALTLPCDIRVIGNSVVSTGRRFFFVPETVEGSRCLIQGNNLVFNLTEGAIYRHPVDCIGSSSTIIGNYIKHPSLAFSATAGSVCTAAGNMMVGGATSVSITKGVLTGNVFNTTTAPVVTIGSAAQTSQGWDFVHVPA